MAATLPRLPGAMREPLVLGIAASVLLHALLLALRFAPPDPLRFLAQDSRLEVVLLNARTTERPEKADVLAQVDMSAGGEHDQGRARSPLKAEREAVDATELVEQRRRVEQLEQQQRWLAALSSGKDPAPPPDRSTPAPVPPFAGDAPTEVERAIARLQAQIDKQISDYNKRPRRLTFGVNAVGVAYARYVADWAARIERIGTERYPPQARGRLYGSLLITVEIDRHGNVLDVVLNRQSPHEVLNRAVRDIVYAGAPYEPFPAEMAREGDILQIVRTWTFTREGVATEAASTP
jgi:protein TonB